MIEALRQFVVFGNFNSVSFEDVSKLEKIKNKFSLQINATQDLNSPQININPNNVLKGGVFIGAPMPIVTRPILKNEKERVNVFFGTSRIHIEQLDFEDNTYKDFNSMALEIIYEIQDKLNLKFNRLALNGHFFNTEKESVNSALKKLIHSSDNFDLQSDEWRFRIVNKEENEKLKCRLNKIIDYNRGKFISSKNVEEDGLIISYDFNTQPGIEKIFTKEDIEFFHSIGSEYREKYLIKE